MRGIQLKCILAAWYEIVGHNMESLLLFFFASTNKEQKMYINGYCQQSLSTVEWSGS